MKKFVFFLILIITAGCGGDTDSIIVIKTKYGDMKAILYEETPLHKENFLKLANDGFYDSLIFHRVIRGFMIQGGDPDSKNANPGAALGSGGPGYTIPAEFNPKLFHKKGALSAARKGDQVNPNKESSGSQFYIVQGQVSSAEQLTTDMNKLASSIGKYLEVTSDTNLRNQLIQLYQTDPNGYLNQLIGLKSTIESELNTSFDRNYPNDRLDAYTTVGGAQHLDDAYTVFGQIVEGLDIIDKIAAERTDPRDRPLSDIHMVISIEEVSKSDITSKYGYEYSALN